MRDNLECTTVHTVRHKIVTQSHVLVQ